MTIHWPSLRKDVESYVKDKSYDSISIIVDRLTKTVHYKPEKITIDALGLAEVIFDVPTRDNSTTSLQ